MFEFVDLNFEALYNEHSSMVYNLALNYVQNIEDAQEITQDVFVAIHKSINSFQEKASISTWIYRITINKSLDFLKAKKRKKRFAFFTSLFYIDNNELKGIPHENNHPGILLENNEALAILLKKIDRLPEKQKTALILHKIEQKPQVDTAEIMNISPKAVESLIKRAKTNLLNDIKNAE